jgi:hypothetical protein
VATRTAKPRPTLRDFIEDDARCICVESFRPSLVTGLVERGRYFKLSDQVVTTWPAFFRIAIPVESLDDEIVIER